MIKFEFLTLFVLTCFWLPTNQIVSGGLQMHGDPSKEHKRFDMAVLKNIFRKQKLDRLGEIKAQLTDCQRSLSKLTANKGPHATVTHTGFSNFGPKIPKAGIDNRIVEIQRLTAELKETNQDKDAAILQLKEYKKVLDIMTKEKTYARMEAEKLQEREQENEYLTEENKYLRNQLEKMASICEN